MDELRQWYCVRTKARNERLARAHLAEELGVSCFLPSARLQRKGAAGLRRIEEAIFPGYLFVEVELAKEYRKVCYARGVLGFVRSGERVPRVPRREIEGLRRFCDLLSEEQEARCALRPGDEVELVGKLFGGAEGKVLSLLPARNRVKVLVEFLNRAVELTISAEKVLKLN